MKNDPEITHVRTPWAMLAVVVLAGIAVYVNSFPGVFLLNDIPGIVDNTAVRDFDLGTLLRGHPVSNITLAINHRLGGDDVRGYHAVNLLVHLLAACTLFGLVRRTLLLPGTRDRFAGGAGWIAFAVALLWVVHPLLTESVTYITGRSEALAGLFYLLTLYCFARGAERGRGFGWYACAVVACALGMGSKPILVTAPLAVLLYDRVFVAASLAEIAKRRWALYAGLAITWVVLVVAGVVGVIFSPGGADVGMGFGYEGITPLGYLAAEPGVILHYLRLSVWPEPLCFDYWWLPPAAGLETAVPAIVVLALVAASIGALWRWPRAGFLGVAFFLILAPTSSFIPSRELAAEHRMYLPLAAVLTLIVLAFHRYVTRPGAARLAPAAVLVLLLVAAGLGAGTVLRNRDYHSAVRMWRDVMTKRPQNPRAPQNLGTMLAEEGHLDEAIAVFRRALEFPEFRDKTYLSIAQAQRRAGRIDQAIEAYRLAIEADPDLTAAYHTLANLLVARGRTPEAMGYFEEVLAREPDNAEAEADFGRTLAAVGDLPNAATHLEHAAKLAPDNPQVHNNLGGVYALQGRLQSALEHVIEAIRLKPDYTEAMENLGRMLVRAPNPDGLVERYADKVDLKPALVMCWTHRGDLEVANRRWLDAISHYEHALRIDPTYEPAKTGLEQARAKQK